MAKQLFNSSESSNFILNMTEDKYSKLASYGLVSALTLVSVMTAVPEIAGDNGLYSLASIGLSVAGVICMILAIIAAMKKYITGRILLPVCTMGIMVLWGAISLLNSYDKAIGFYGFSGRGEGLLAIIFYFCFFITAASVKKQKAFDTILKCTVTMGLVNAAFGLLQTFTGLFSTYKKITISTRGFADSGLAQSPLFLAMVLSIAMTAAVISAVLSDSKKYRLFCIVSLCVMSMAAMFTYSLIALCGLAFAAVSAVVAVFAFKAPKIRLASLLAIAAPACAAVLIVNAGVIGDLKSYQLHDGEILWWADSFYRLSASGAPDTERVDISDTFDVYYYLNSKTMNIISGAPVTGTGPEQLVFPQLYTNKDANGVELTELEDIIMNNTGTFDKVYNEYLYTAATRGIPSTVALAVTILASLFIGLRNVKKKKSTDSLCFFMMTLCGTVIFFVGCSNITFAPFFWIAAGASCADLISDKASRANEKKTAKNSKNLTK